MLNASKSASIARVLNPFPIPVHLHFVVRPGFMLLRHAIQLLNTPKYPIQNKHHNPAKVDDMYCPPPMLHTNSTIRKLKDPFPALALVGIKIRRQEARVARVVAHHAAERDFANMWRRFDVCT
jgi:hypothetical protein